MFWYVGHGRRSFVCANWSYRSRWIRQNSWKRCPEGGGGGGNRRKQMVRALWEWPVRWKSPTTNCPFGNASPSLPSCVLFSKKADSAGTGIQLLSTHTNGRLRRRGVGFEWLAVEMKNYCLWLCLWNYMTFIVPQSCMKHIVSRCNLTSAIYIYIYKCIRIRIATEVQYHLVINPSSFHISVTPMNARLMMHPAICRDFARTPIKKPSTRKSE